MTSKEVSEYKGKYIKFTDDDEYMLITKVVVDGVWVDSYGPIIDTKSGDITSEVHRDLATRKRGTKDEYEINEGIVVIDKDEMVQTITKHCEMLYKTFNLDVSAEN